MARVTITDAVKQGFASRPTIYRAIKAGRLTPHQDGRRRLVDVADLVQVFGEPSPPGAPRPAGGILRPITSAMRMPACRPN